MKKIYLHPLPVRVWHWINAIGFIILILTGVQIRFVDQVGLMSFETAVQIHSWLGFILLANYFIWFVYYIFTGKFFKIYIPPFWKPVEFIKSCIRQAKYYAYGIMIGDENPHHPVPENKFNPLQQISYLFIMAVLIPVQIITGLMSGILSFWLSGEFNWRNSDCYIDSYCTMDIFQCFHNCSFLPRNTWGYTNDTY